MRKSLLVLLIAVLLPSLVLGWLAIRGAEEQQIVLERRTAELLQAETDSVAAAARIQVDEERRRFEAAVERLLSGTDAPAAVAAKFPTALAGEWPRNAIGFVVGDGGRLIAPTTRDAAQKPEWQQFLWDNGGFLGNKLVATVYPVAVEELSRPEQLRKGAYQQQQQASVKAKSQPPALPAMKKAEAELGKSSGNPNDGVLVLRDSDQRQPWANVARNVAPQQMAADAAPVSQVMGATSNFRDLIAGERSGIVNRFVQDRLNMIFWVRPEKAPDLIFGCLVEAKDFTDLWKEALGAELKMGRRVAGDSKPEYVLGLLDDKGQPVALHPAGAQVGDLRRPFVASEVGEALPHWEAALYLLKPDQLQESARNVRHVLYLLIGTSLLAISAGAAVVIADTRRQIALAQKKTDFVSNVSHELKTPLTSIRMFAELMSTSDIAPDKRQQYLRIITLESERLTRLINNVLDFARIERRQKRLDLKSVDLCEVIARVWESQELHLRDEGFTTRWDAAPGPYPAIADADAVSQILVNLISNAVKYSPGVKEVTMQTFMDAGRLQVAILDRGTGVPKGEERKIYEAFYRAHDSLASGIQGSGLGLTLAQRLAQEHGGDITLQSRPGGGSIFTLRLPLQTVAPTHQMT